VTKRAVTTLALAALIALALAGFAATSRAQDGQRTVSLSPGCNMVTLSFVGGTQAATVAAVVSPPTALQAIWRLDNDSRSFQAFMPQASQASDLTSVNLLDVVFICVDAAASIAMPEVSTDLAGSPISVSLSTGCNAVGLSFTDGTNPSEVAAAVTPAGALQSIWRLDNTTHAFQAYVAAAPQASDLTSLSFLDAVFICTGGPATLAMSAVTQPAGGAVQPPPPPAGTGEEAIRYVMEAAVPQIVDLPQGFVAVDEEFGSLGPPGPLYYYDISYGNAFSLIGGTTESLSFASFSLGLFDTVDHAKSFMGELTSISAEDFKAELEPEFGGALGLEIGSLTIQEVEPLTTIAEDADFIRVRMQVRPVQSNEFFLPMAMDIYTVRRDRIVGEVFASWAPGPPGPKFVTENLAKKMDAGIQQALPQLLSAVP
jgi:hypothetical protein